MTTNPTGMNMRPLSEQSATVFAAGSSHPASIIKTIEHIVISSIVPITATVYSASRARRGHRRTPLTLVSYPFMGIQPHVAVRLG
jgi:hypothetical protein